MQAQPYLAFHGQCKAAFQFYADRLGGKIEMLIPYAGSPIADEMGPEWSDAVMHARLRIGDTVVLGSDSPQEREKPRGFSMSMTVVEVGEAKRVFEVLSESGEVQVPLDQTFFSPMFGMVTDQFGIPWMVYCDASA